MPWRVLFVSGSAMCFPRNRSSVCKKGGSATIAAAVLEVYRAR